MDNTANLIEMTADVVSAYVSNNVVPSAELPAIISSVHAALATVDQEVAPVPEQKPAVPIKKSIGADHIVCLEDGKKFKSLKRHLRSKYGLSPEEYREKWGLPADYPMVAPNYAKQRSELAKQMGLGRIPRTSKS